MRLTDGAEEEQAALSVGVIAQLVGGHLGTKWREPVAFGILFLVLIFKPTGLFGQKDLERV